MPSRVLADYFVLVDQLRNQRRDANWRAENDREIIARLDDMYEQLSDDEREEVEAQSHRAWPESDDAEA